MRQFQLALAIRDLIKREGGFSNSKIDRGGATQYGISLAWARRIGLDLDHDGDTDIDDIRLLTPAKATELYEKHFYYDCGIYKLPEAMREAVMDWGVHSGPPRAVMELQRRINLHTTHLDEPFGALKVDGRIGPITVGAVEEVITKIGIDTLLTEYIDQRAEFLRDLAENDPTQRGNANGWANRLTELRRLLNLPKSRG